MAKAQKNRASKHPNISPSQVTLARFESPFSKSLDPDNRWVIMVHKNPLDIVVSTYEGQLNNSNLGAEGINCINAKILGLSHAKSDSHSDDKSDTNNPGGESQTT